jgi:hypothetical protein
MRLFLQSPGQGAGGDGEDEDDEEEAAGPSVQMVEAACDAGVLQTIQELCSARTSAGRRSCGSCAAWWRRSGR